MYTETIKCSSILLDTTNILISTPITLKAFSIQKAKKLVAYKISTIRCKHTEVSKDTAIDGSIYLYATTIKHFLYNILNDLL